MTATMSDVILMYIMIKIFFVDGQAHQVLQQLSYEP